MRFTPYPRPPRRTASPRRMAAARRAVTAQKARYPLFADQFVTESPGERVERQLDEYHLWIEEDRRRHAEHWRRVRRRLYSLPEPYQAEILRYWNTHRWLPGNPVYLDDLITTTMRETAEQGGASNGQERDL